MSSLTVRQLYTSGSLRNATDGFCFAIENRLSDTVVTRLASLQVDGHEIPADHLQLELSSGEVLPVQTVTPEHPLAFARRVTRAAGRPRRSFTSGSRSMNESS